MSEPAFLSVLRQMRLTDAQRRYEDAELVGEGRSFWLAYRRVSRSTVNQLLRLVAISDCSDAGGAALERYKINEVGRAIVRRPEIIAEIETALRTGGAFTVRDNRIVSLISQ